MASSTEESKLHGDLQTYLDKHEISGLFSELVERLLTHLPGDPHQFIADELYRKFSVSEKVSSGAIGGAASNGGYEAKGNDAPAEAASDSSDDDDDDEYDDYSEVLPEKKTATTRTARRISVSASVFDLKQIDHQAPKVFPKSEAEKTEIRHILDTALLFKKLNVEQKGTLIDAFEKCEFAAGDEIISQNCAKADYYYVMIAGGADVFVNEVQVSSYTEHSGFGELALLYNAPRAATIKATTTCVCFRLERLTFKAIVIAGVTMLREKRIEFLKKVPMFKTNLTELEFNQLADACVEMNYVAGDDIVHQGETGHNFFIIEDGKVTFLKEGEETGDIATSGNAFGERALIRNEPRAVSVRAITDCKMHVVEKTAFTRVLGSMEDILYRQYGQTNTCMRNL